MEEAVTTLHDYENGEYRDRDEYLDACIEGPHDWRLMSEERIREEPDTPDGRPNFLRRWYCTRCRLVESWSSQ
jgi:hypothetical protein